MPMRSYLALRWLTALLTAATFFTLIRPAGADGGGHLQQMVDGYQVELVYEDNLNPGVIPVRVHLADAEGQRVPDAKVQVVQNLISSAETSGHSATEADTHGEVEGEAQADAEDDHGAATDHTEAGATPGQAEPTQAHPDTGAHAEADAHDESGADPHDEAVPHTHDDSSLFQLSWDDEASAYTSSVIFFQAGQWAVHVEFVIDGYERVAEFVVEVAAPDPGRAVLAGFAGLNVAILGAAALFKRKSTAA